MRVLHSTVHLIIYNKSVMQQQYHKCELIMNYPPVPSSVH